MALKQAIDPRGTNATTHDEEYDYLVKEYSVLSKIAHHEIDTDEDEAQEKLESMEKILEKLTVPQLTVYKRIDKFMSEAPSIGAAKKIIDMCFRQATFDHVIKDLSCDWLPYMHEAGFFANPPSTLARQKSDDRTSDASTCTRPVKFRPYDHQAWAPSAYLEKCAKARPELVTKIILGCRFYRGDNPTIYASFLECAQRMPVDYAVGIVQKSINDRWIDFVRTSTYSANRVSQLGMADGMAKKYVLLSQKMFSELRPDIAMLITEKIFGPDEEDVTPHSKIVDSSGKEIFKPVRTKAAKYPFEAFWYERHLSEVLASMPDENLPDVAALLLDLLDKALEIEAPHLEPGQQPPPTSLWRSAIETHEQNWPNGIKSLYVEHLHKILISLGRDSMESLKSIMPQMAEKTNRIFRRMELYVYSEFPAHFAKELNRALLEFFDDIDCHHEYYALRKRGFGLASEQTRNSILSMIDAGFSSEKLDDLKASHTPEEIRHMEDYWRLSHLTPIKEHLDGPHAAAFEDLQRKLKPIEHPDFRIYHSVTHETLGSGDYFDNMNTDHAFERVKSYKPGESDYTVEDIGEMFGRYVAKNPSECSLRATELKGSDADIQRCFFNGINTAVENNATVDWDSILSLVEYIMANRDGCSDMRLRSSISSICNLVEKALKTDAIDISYMDRLWKCIKAIADLATGCPDDGDHSSTQWDDSFNVALNSINGTSFLILCYYSQWRERHSGAKELEPRVKQAFDDYVNNETKHTMSRHAVLGFCMAYLHGHDREWTNSIVGKMQQTPENNLKIAFWDGYVSNNRLFSDIYEDHHELYGRHLRVNGVLEKSRSRNAYNSTITHMALAYFYNLKKAGEYFERFLSEAKRDCKEHGDGASVPIQHCTFSIAQIMQDKEVDAEFDKAKLIKLWENDAFAGQQHLHLWFKNSPLDKKDTIKLYKDYLAGCQGPINLTKVFMDEFKKFIPEHSCQVADCLLMLVKNPEYNYVPIGDIVELLGLLRKDPNVQSDTLGQIRESLAKLGHDFKDPL